MAGLELYPYNKCIKEIASIMMRGGESCAIIDSILKKAGEMVNTHKVVLFLSDGDFYRIGYHIGLNPGKIKGIRIRKDRSLISLLRESKEILNIKDIDKSLQRNIFGSMRCNWKYLDAESIISLFYQKKLIGFVTLSNCSLQPQNLIVIRMIAAHLALMIANGKLLNKTMFDESSELYQETYLRRRIMEEGDRAFRYGVPIFLFLIGIEGIEKGGEKMNRCLGGVINRLKDNLRDSDSLCKYGDDTLAFIVTPNIQYERYGSQRELNFMIYRQMYSIGERLIREVDISSVMRNNGSGVSINIGISSSKIGKRIDTDRLFRDAEEALHRTGDEGGNRVEISCEENKAQDIRVESHALDKGNNGMICYDSLKIDIQAHEVYLRDQEIGLRPKEFDLLVKLVEKRGKLLSRAFLTESVWGYEYFGTTRTVDTHIKNLRKKLGDYGKNIKTIEGIGYKFTNKNNENNY